MAIGNLFTLEERERFADEISTMKSQAKNISTDGILNAIVAMRDRPSSVDYLNNKDFLIQYIYGSKDEIISPNIIVSEIQMLNATGIQLNSGHMSLLTDHEKIKKALLIE